MKIAAIVASLVASKLLAADAKPEAVSIELNKLLAADKKAKDEAKEKEDKEAADKAAKDAEKEDPEGTNDADMDDVDGEDEFPEKPEGGGEKPAATNIKAKDKRGKDKAMDAAISAAIAANDAKHVAAREVESILGVVSYDSADKFYKAALDKLGVPTEGVHVSALPALLKLAKDKATASAPIVGDSAASADMVKNIPGLSRLRK